MQRLSIALAIVAAFATTTAATAQEKKKKPNSEQNSAQSSSPKSAPSGGQSCNGMLWVGSICTMPDGRVCEVADGTSGNAILRCTNR